MSKMKSVYGEPKDNYTFKIRLKSTILVIWFVILTIICLLPIYILIINATRELPKSLTVFLSFPVRILVRTSTLFSMMLTTTRSTM